MRETLSNSTTNEGKTICKIVGELKIAPDRLKNVDLQTDCICSRVGIKSKLTRQVPLEDYTLVVEKT